MAKNKFRFDAAIHSTDDITYLLWEEEKRRCHRFANGSVKLIVGDNSLSLYAASSALFTSTIETCTLLPAFSWRKIEINAKAVTARRIHGVEFIFSYFRCLFMIPEATATFLPTIYKKGDSRFCRAHVHTFPRQ